MGRLDFEISLAQGQIGENRIARWLRAKGWYILPVYEIELSHGKGPRLFAPTGKLIAPDMFTFRRNEGFWIEAKHKSAFTWHRISRRWTTGIDLRHYVDYCKVDDETPWPVWLMFLQEGLQAKDSPPNNPSGLYGRPLSYLRLHENHRHPNGGNNGMVYWAEKALIKLASLCEVNETTHQPQPKE